MISFVAVSLTLIFGSMIAGAAGMGWPGAAVVIVFVLSFWIIGNRKGGWRWRNGPPVEGFIDWMLLLVLLGSGTTLLMALLLSL